MAGSLAQTPSLGLQTAEAATVGLEGGSGVAVETASAARHRFLMGVLLVVCRLVAVRQYSPYGQGCKNKADPWQKNVVGRLLWSP